MDYTRRFLSPLGPMLIACDGEALTGLWFEGQRHFAAGLSPDRQERDLPLFAEAERWLSVYFSGRRPDFTPPLRFRGTPFQQAVWRALLDIPYGETITYASLAAALPRPSGPRAVGSAVGRNPISLIVPCHRVVGKNGALTGYAGGTERKAYLLALEQAERKDAK